MSNQNLEFEKGVLRKYLTDLRGFVAGESDELSKRHKQYLEDLKDVKIAGSLDDRSSALSQAVKQLKKINYSGRVRYLERIKKILKSPYFSRIDISSADAPKTQSYYLGKTHYTSKIDRNLAITDWRAPVASIYYNYPFPIKNASYSVYTEASLDVEEIKYVCNLELRRTIDIEGGEIYNIYDNSQAGNINKDAFLMTKLDQKSGGQLEDIIETIQSDQYKIIINNPTQNLIVQGVAGSGKTSVAIHRISYIFYNFANLVKPEKTIFISASKVLINYLAKSLPELDVQEIKRLSLHDLLAFLLAENQIKLRTGVINTTDESDYDSYFNDIGAFLNNHADFASRLDAELKLILKDDILSTEIADMVRIKRALSKLFDKPIFQVLSFLEIELKDVVKDLRKEVSFSSDVSMQLLRAESSLSRLQKFKKSFSLERAYANFLKTYYSRAPKVWDINHFAAIYYLASKLGLITNMTDYDLVVVDEAQDLNKVHLSCLKTLSSKNCFNFYGDLNQSVSKRYSLQAWHEVSDIFGVASTISFNLYVSFRSTRQIIERASQELIEAGIKDNIPLSVVREGELPRDVIVDSFDALVDRLAGDITGLRKVKNKSIGIITSGDFSQARLLARLEKHNIVAQLINESFEDFEHDGIYLVDINLVKGLEFDSVFIVNMNASVFADKIGGHFKKFVAITRAMSDVFIYRMKK